MSNKTSFKSGLLFGAVLGGLAAFFLSPKSGKENRELAQSKFEELRKMLKEKKVDEVVKEIYGKATEEGKKLYLSARKDIDSKLEEMKERLDEVDKDKYKSIVEDVISTIKDEKDATTERVTKLSAYLMNRWDEAQKMAKSDAKTVIKKKNA